MAFRRAGRELSKGDKSTGLEGREAGRRLAYKEVSGKLVRREALGVTRQDLEDS